MARSSGDAAARAAAMERVNPLYIPRNHLIEAALQKAEAGDLSDWQTLLEVVRIPFTPQAGREAFAMAGDKFGPAYRTFCGT